MFYIGNSLDRSGVVRVYCSRSIKTNFGNKNFIKNTGKGNSVFTTDIKGKLHQEDGICDGEIQYEKGKIYYIEEINLFGLMKTGMGVLDSGTNTPEFTYQQWMINYKNHYWNGDQ